MALNLNRILIAGNMTRDAEVTMTANDKCVAKFGLAINRRFKDGNGEAREETTFVDVEAWGKTAEFVGRYLKKGSGCFVEGRLKMDSWQDKVTGAQRTKLLVVADNVQGTDSKGERTAAPSDDTIAPAGSPRRPVASGGDDEPPF